MTGLPRFSLWRSVHAKALVVATGSLALVAAILFWFSTAWLKRERHEAEHRRAQMLLRHLATNLQFGVLLKSADAIEEQLRSAFIAREVHAAAVFDRDGNLLAQHSETADSLSRLPASYLERSLTQDGVFSVVEDSTYWILATHIEKSATPLAGAAPADYQPFTATAGRGEKVGTVIIAWDLTAGRQWLAAFQRRFIAFSAAAFVLVAIPTALLTFYLNRGFSQLLQATHHVRQGNFHYRIASERGDELGDVMRAFDSMVQRTEEITEQLEQERGRALSASKAKSDFLANMSHELRTPLNAIIGFSELLSEPLFGELTDKQRSYVSDVLESGKHLLSLINDILDLAKIESGKMQLEPEELDLRDVLTSGLRLISERATRHGVQLSCDLPDDARRIVADHRKLKQLVFNLLSNAVKFTPDGGAVGVRAWRQDGSVRICVWDTGIGIPPHEREKIFEDFYQVSDSTVKAQQGTGLGLSLVRKIAELHGGNVWVESEVGHGSQFFVDLPQKRRRRRRRGSDVLKASPSPSPPSPRPSLDYSPSCRVGRASRVAGGSSLAHWIRQLKRSVIRSPVGLR